MRNQGLDDLYVNKMTAQIPNTRVGAQTSTRIRALRLEEKKAKPLALVLQGAFNDAVSAFSALLSSQTGNCNKMCANYGHIIDQQNWSGHLPRCSDCGQIIHDPKSLRRSSADKVDPNAERFVMNDSGKWTRAN
ncbi:MAG: hypothetical protein K2X27_16910 [Candidatus Obscuribacterales bacterium]|nr:hypothetical protein [Candidatus Obscuribacterales bacterium]